MTNGAWPKPKPKVEQLDSGTPAAPVVADAPAQPATAQPAPTQTTAAPPPATRAPNVGPGAGVTNELTRRPTSFVDDDDTASGTITDEYGNPFTVSAVPRPKAKGPAMAQVEAKYTVSPELGRVRDARLQQEAAQNKLTDALVAQEAKRAEVLDETADALEQESVRLSEIRERALQESIQQTQKLQAQADEIGASAPQAGRLFGTGAQAASFGAALSIATGAMLSARTGGPNVALKIVDQAIQRDMEVQREAIKNKRFAAEMGLNIAQEMRAAYRDDIAASNAMQATLLRYAENRIQAVIAQTNEPVLRARGEQTIADMRMQYAKLVEELTRQSFGMRMALPLRQAQGMLAASVGQTLPPESDEDAAAQAESGRIAQTQQGLEAQAQNTRKRGAQARQAAQAGAQRSRQQKQRQAQQAAQLPQGWARSRLPGVYFIPSADAPIPPGFRRGMFGGRPIAINPAEGQLGQLSSKERDRREAIKPQRFKLPAGFDVKDSETPVLGEGRDAHWMVDAKDYLGGAEQLKLDKAAAQKAARAYQKFAVIVEKVKKLGEKAEREGKSFFEADRAAVNALINPAIGIVNDMMNGGVLNAGEREIHKQYLYDPTELLFRFWKKPDADRTYAGWDSVQRLLKDVRDNAFRVVGNKGNVGELGGTIDYSTAGMLDENMKRK